MALKDNAPDIETMKQGVFASLKHIASTDAELRHEDCPTGSDSWCHYQQETANSTDCPPHSTDLTQHCFDQLLPVYNRLTEPNMSRCTNMLTQNANELKASTARYGEDLRKHYLPPYNS